MSSMDHRTQAVELPVGLDLILGDISFGGSSTPSMVAAVLKWKASGGAAQEHWDLLHAQNTQALAAVRECVAFSKDDPSGWQSALQRWDVRACPAEGKS